jgi:hypothetical protein
MRDWWRSIWKMKLMRFRVSLDNLWVLYFVAKRDEIDEKFKELKLSKGQDTILIRQLKSDIESKKREIIEASDLINRVTTELEEVRHENSHLKKCVEKYEKEQFNMNAKYKKLERAMYKSNWEQKKLHSVIQMQKDSLSDLQREYFSTHDVGYSNAMKTFDQIPPLLDMTNQWEGSMIVNNKHRSNLFIKELNKENLMNSFDNILTPLDNRTHYEQISPFSSAKTLNKLGKTSKKMNFRKSENLNNTTICNRFIHDVSDSHHTIKEASLERTDSDMPNYETCRGSHYRSHSKNISMSSSKFAYIAENSSNSVIKSGSKYTMSKQKTERRSNGVNSPLSDQSSKKDTSGQKKGKIKIINRMKKDSSGKFSHCLIQPPPCMKTVNNYKTFREASLPRSITSLNNLIDQKVEKSSRNKESRNKGFIIFPSQSRDMMSPISSTVNSACNLNASKKKNQSIIQCKRKKYK